VPDKKTYFIPEDPGYKRKKSDENSNFTEISLSGH
jgi:hypothetical protein